MFLVALPIGPIGLIGLISYIFSPLYFFGFLLKNSEIVKNNSLFCIMNFEFICIFAPIGK